MNKYTFNRANIYLGSCESKHQFNKENDSEFIDNLKMELIAKYKYKTYFEKKIYDKNYIYISPSCLYKYTLVHNFIKDTNIFYELLDLHEIPTTQFNNKKEYEYEEINNIEEFIVSNKISILINKNNHVYIQVIRDEYWDETIVTLQQIMADLGCHNH
jgi:hypothetical protein